MIEGFVEKVLPDQITGWTFDRASPALHLEVRASCGEQLLATAHANNFRPDLAASRIGDGDHAFYLKFPALPDPEALASVVVRAYSADDPVGIRELPRFTGRRGAAARPLLPGLAAAEFQDHSQFPVFVLGAPRSGTSAVAQALKAATPYGGYNEGHVTDLLGPLLQAVREFYGAKADEIAVPERATMIKRVPEEYFIGGICRLFSDAAGRLYSSPRWCEKTPTADMIRAAPMLLRIWPNAKFLFCRRRGLENVQSRVRKFSGVPFEFQCLQWAAHMEAWRRVRAELADRSLELDQYFLARHPDQAAAAIGRLLTLEATDVAELARVLERLQPERTSESVLAVSDAADMDWNGPQWEVFDRICGPTMRRFGYSRDREYFVADGGGAGIIEPGQALPLTLS